MIVDDLFESTQTCPECGGPAFSDLLLAEKKDACYHKVRSRYKVWPSAYASGALVQCRKKGAANWGNKSKNEGVAEGANVTSQIKRIKDRILQLKDWNTAGTHDKKIKELQAKLKELQQQKQGVAEDQLDEKCWDTHRQAGMKKKGDRMVPNCVPKEGVEEGSFAGDTRVELGGATVKKLQAGDTVTYFGEKARVVELNPAKNYARISANGKTLNVRLSDLNRTGQGVEEAQYDRGDYYNAHKAGEYGRDLPYDDDRRGHGASRSTERDGRDDHLAGQSANLPADPFGRTTGAVPKAGTGRIHNIALPGEIDEADKIGNMDADRFDNAMSRLKQLAGQGPRKTVWDPVKRVYKTVPVNPPQSK